MKKLSSIFALLILMATLAACSKTEEVPPVDEVAPVDEPEVEEVAPVSQEDTVNTGEVTFENAKKELELINE